MKLPKEVFTLIIKSKEGKQYRKVYVAVDEKDARFQAIQESLKHDDDIEILSCSKNK